MAIIRMIEGCDTFDEVLLAAEVLYKFCKKEKEDKVDDMPMPPGETGGESNEPANIPVTQQDDNPGEGSGDSGEQEITSQGDQVASAPLSDEPEVQTADALQGNLQDLINSESMENVYVEIPQVDLKYIIAEMMIFIKILTCGSIIRRIIVRSIFLKELMKSLLNSNVMHRKKLTIW